MSLPALSVVCVNIDLADELPGLVQDLQSFFPVPL